MCSGYGGSGRCNVVVGDSYGVTFWPEYSCDEFIYPCILKIYISISISILITFIISR